MTTEIRQVVLDNNELRAALDANAADGDQKFGDARILSAVIGNEGKDVVLTVISGAAQEQHTLTLSAIRVAAALIKFCMRRRIPLPKGATKYLCVSGENLGLRVTLKTESVAQVKA